MWSRAVVPGIRNVLISVSVCVFYKFITSFLTFFFIFVRPGPRCQRSSTWWVSTSSEGISTTTWQSIKPCCWFYLTNRILWNFGLPNQISHFLSSSVISDPPLRVVSFFCWEHRLPSRISRFSQVAFSARSELSATLWRCWIVAVTWLLQSGSILELFIHSDSNGQKSLESQHQRILLVLPVLWAFPVLKNKRVLCTIYSIYEKKKPWQKTGHRQWVEY